MRRCDADGDAFGGYDREELLKNGTILPRFEAGGPGSERLIGAGFFQSLKWYCNCLLTPAVDSGQCVNIRIIAIIL